MSDERHGLEKLAIIYSLPFAFLMWRFDFSSLSIFYADKLLQYASLPAGVLCGMVQTW